MPVNLTATAVSTSEINLAWDTATDNVGVTGYRVYRDGDPAPIATVAGTSYSDSGLAADTTYDYQVEAYDAAGNSSARSPAEAATTQSDGGGGPPDASSGGGGCGLGMIRPGPPSSRETALFLVTLLWPLAVLTGWKLYSRCCSA
jgi:ABC-type Na+ efflux pump permease subunit